MPAQVVKGRAFRWAAWGPKQLPCTYRRPAGPSTPRVPGCVPTAPGGATRKGRHALSSWPRSGRARGVLSQTLTRKHVSRPADSCWRVSGPSRISLVSWDMCFWVRPFHVMGNTTGWEKPQSTKSYRGPSNLFMSPVSTGKKMSSVETRVIKRSSGGCEHQGPSAMVQGPQRGKPPDTWDKLQDREQRAFTCLNWDTFPKVNLKWMIQQCSGRPMFPLLLRELGWNRTRCSGKL